MNRPKTVYDLMVEAAPVIAGRPVIFRYETPFTTNSYGTITINKKNIPVVTVSNLLIDTLSTYLHELAHVRLHADRMEKSNWDTAPARSYQVPKYKKSPTREAQADAMRDEWLKIGKANADPSLPGDEGILLALIDYYTKDKKK